jgi:hypothetical protein
MRNDLNKIYYVYFLINSRNNLPFYVGKGKGRRMFIHVKSALRGRILDRNKKKHYKIRSIFKNHGRVLYRKVIKDVSENLAYKFEVILVKSIGRENLCNLTDGGDGLSNPSNKTRRKMSLSHKGKISGFLGKHHSKKSKRKLCLSHLGRAHSLEQKRKISLAHLGKKLSKKTRKKISIANLGKHLSKITREKLSKANLGKHLSKDTRRKMSLAQKGIKKSKKQKLLMRVGWIKKRRIKNVF